MTRSRPSAERPKEPLMYTVGYYNDEDFRAFYSGQDAANIDGLLH